MIVIVDYGMGNLGSIRNMLKKIGHESVAASEPAQILKAQKLILPGVGAFDRGMSNLSQNGLIPALTQKVKEQKTPVMGICLGMQLMTAKSEEGQVPGLGWFQAETVRFKFEAEKASFKIPHMGWNHVRGCRSSRLLDGLGEDSRFYFVHSYHVRCRDASDELLKAHYGYDFVCAMQRENIYGVQFHPEKSHRFGMQLLKNFVDFC